MIDTVMEYIIHINVYHSYSVKGDVVVKIREEMEIFLWVLPVGS
jgi:hypothetical protein